MISSCFLTIRRSSQCILVIPIRTKLSCFHLLRSYKKQEQDKAKTRAWFYYSQSNNCLVWKLIISTCCSVLFESSDQKLFKKDKHYSRHNNIGKKPKKKLQKKCQVKAPVCCIVHNLSQLNTSNWFKQQGEMIFIQNEEKA